MRSCCWTAPAGINAASACACRRTSPCSTYPPTAPNSIQRKTSGDSCAATNCPPWFGTPTRPASMLASARGTSSSVTQSASAPSAPGTGHVSVFNRVGITLPRDIDADLDSWLEPFLEATGRKTRRKMAPLYVRGLLGGGGRKSIQPMAERLGLPGHDQLHHFISSPAWDDAPL